MCNETIKYLTKKQLTLLNNKAIRAGLTNYISKGNLLLLTEEDKLPVLEVSFAGAFLSLEIMLSEQGACGRLDITGEEYETLPQLPVDPDVFQALEDLFENPAPQYH